MHYVAFLLFHGVSYTQMCFGQKSNVEPLQVIKDISNINMFTLVLSTIVSMSINVISHYDCLLPGFKNKIICQKPICKQFLHNFRQGRITFQSQPGK